MVYSLKLREMLEEGREEGRKEGREEGRKEGRREGRMEGIIETLVSLAKDGIISKKDAAVRSNMELEEFEKVYNKLAE